MARVVLVNFAGYPCTYSSLLPDNGLAALAGVLLDAGHTVKILDFGTVETVQRLMPGSARKLLAPLGRRIFRENLPPRKRDVAKLFLADWLIERHKKREFERIAEEVALEADRFGANLVGLKLWNGDGLTGSIAIAQAVKRRLPETVVFGGGPQVDWFGRHILDHTDAFDGLARGDGEMMIAGLAEYADGRLPLEIVPNVIHRGGENALSRVESLDELPVPAYGRCEYAAPHSGGQIRFVVIDESRGCPGKCTFCIHPQKSGGRWLIKSPQRVLHEMIQARALLGVERFVYAGSNTPAKAANDNAEAILDLGLNVEYACFGHVNGMRNADFNLMYRSGCRAVFYGVESADQRLLDEIYRKGTRPEQIRDVLVRTKQAGIATLASIIFPSPGEDADSERRTEELLTSVRPDGVPVQFPGIIPGSEWWSHPEKFGFRMTRHGRRLWAYALTYKIKLLFPPRYWRPLPYSIDGRSYREFSARTEAFVKRLEGAGIVTGVGHDLALMAHALGLPLREFRDMTRLHFFTGDFESVQDTVDRINRSRVTGSVAPVAEVAATASMT